MNKNTPEFYGYEIGKNIVPFINKCIAEAGECYISAGTHIVGSSNSPWAAGEDVWKNNIIQWGWGVNDKVKLIGAGHDKTILKIIDNNQCIKHMTKQFPYLFILQTNYNQSCNDTLIEGITFDGNYANNKVGATTINGIRIRGERNIVRNCKFINFGVGDNSVYECFQVSLLSISPDGVGGVVENNLFELPGKKDKNAVGFIPENTFIAVSGNNFVIQNNTFKDCESNAISQRSPLHGITIGGQFPTKNVTIRNNVFENYQGVAIYIDSWSNDTVLITENTAKNVWIFLYISSQKWPTAGQTSVSKNFKLTNNRVVLSNEKAYYQWNDASSFDPVFFGYNNDPSVDRKKIVGFSNFEFDNNLIRINTNIDKSFIKCFYGNPVEKDVIKTSNNMFVDNDAEMKFSEVQLIVRKLMVAVQDASKALGIEIK